MSVLPRDETRRDETRGRKHTSYGSVSAVPILRHAACMCMRARMHMKVPTGRDPGSGDVERKNVRYRGSRL